MNTTRIVVAACLLCLVVSASADGVLEQMENEVAAIAQRTKSAVVTIEDSRALLISYDTSPLEKADIANRIAHLKIDKAAQEEQLKIQDARYRNGLSTFQESENTRHQVDRLTLQLAAEQRNLEQFGHVTPQQRQRQQADDALALLAIDQRAAQTLLSYSEQLYKAGQTTMEKVNEYRTQLDNVRQEISAQTTRRAILSDAAHQTIDGDRSGGVQAAHQQTEPGKAYTTALIQARLQIQQADANANAPRTGTGFSIGEGYIVTTADVLDGMSNPIVITDAGAQIRARVVAIDSELNVGLVKLVAQIMIPALNLGDSTKVMPGHFAISIGNQHGDANAVSLNLISGIRLEATSSGGHFYPSLIQIGGTVGAGTSGAPLVNSHGDVIGIMAGVPQAEADTSSTSHSASQPEFGWQTGMPSGLYYMQAQPNEPYPTLSASSYFLANPSFSNPSFSNPSFANSSLANSSLANSSRYSTTIPALNRNVMLNGRQIASLAKPAAKKINHGTKKTRGGRANLKATASKAPAQATNLKYLSLQANNSHSKPANWINDPITRHNLYAYNLGRATPALYTANPATPVAANTYWNYVAPKSPPVVTSSGFAIPISEVQSVLADMKAGKTIVHGWIGVDLENLERGTEQGGVVTVSRTVKVKGIYTGAPAQQGGILPGDILVSLNGKPVHTIGEVRVAIIKSALAVPTTAVIDRNGAIHTITLKVDARPAETGKLITTSVKDNGK